MKLHDAYEQADRIVLHLGAAAYETAHFIDRQEARMHDGVPPEFDGAFYWEGGDHPYFVRWGEDLTLVDGRATVLLALGSDGATIPGVLEFFVHAPLQGPDTTQAPPAPPPPQALDYGMNHPQAWYHTPADKPTTANVVNACRLLAEDLHAGLYAQRGHVVSALSTAADLLQGTAPNPTDTEILIRQHTALMARVRAHREHLLGSIPGYAGLATACRASADAVEEADKTKEHNRPRFKAACEEAARAANAIADLIETANPELMDQVQRLDEILGDL